MKITQSEFIGATITKEGIYGTIIDETKNTFTVEHNGEKKMIVKQGQLTIANHKIDGKQLVGRPEDRIKK